MSGPMSPTHNPVLNERGNTTRVLLLVLLLVVAAGGGYLYYFTDLIRPVKEAAKPPVAQTAQVKQPIPPRPSQTSVPGETPAKGPDAKPSKAVPPAAPAASQVKPEAEHKGAPAAPSPAKPQPAKVAKAEAPQKPAVAVPPPAAPAKPVAPQPKVVTATGPVKPATPPAPAKPAAPAVKPAAPQPKAAAATGPARPAAPAKAPRKVAKRAAKAKKGAYTLQVGDFVPDKSLQAIQAKLKKSGIQPVRMAAVTAPEPMKRLEVALFTDQDTAEAELQKLKKLTADAFLIADNGTYSLYAGSYFSASRLQSEQRRLGAKGIKTVVRKIQAPVKVMRVSAGSYASAEEARSDEHRLKKLGLTARVVRAGKQ